MARRMNSLNHRLKTFSLRGSSMVFLSFMLILVTALTGSLSDVARFSAAKTMALDDGQLALENILAEYEREIFDDYHVFFVDAAELGGDTGASELGNEYLDFMTAEAGFHNWMGMSAGFDSFSFTKSMTEHDCEFFARQAANFMKSAAIINSVVDAAESIEVPDLDEKENEANERSRMIADALPDEPLPENPDKAAEKQAREDYKKLRKDADSSGITLGALLPRGAVISTRELHESKWAVTADDKSEGTGIVDKGFLKAYALHHFSDYVTKKDEKARALSYEKEYLIAGHDSDKKNLEAVALMLFGIRSGIRFAANELDETIQTEASALAASISSALMMPPLYPIVQHLYILARSVFEAKEDVRRLYEGGEVPLFPGKSNMTIDYGKYLAVLLAPVNTKDMSVRMVKLIEGNVRLRYKADFNASYCYVAAAGTVSLSVEPRFIAIPFIGRYTGRGKKGFSTSLSVQADLTD